MIKISVIKESNKIKEVMISGHACYDDFGKDIVCAATSAIVITTINAILAFDDKAISHNDGNNLVIKILKDDEITSKLILNMINELKELACDYKENIKFL